MQAAGAATVMDSVLIGTILFLSLMGALLMYRRGVNRLLDFAARPARSARGACPLRLSAAHVSHDPRYFWARPSPSARFRYDCIDCGREEMDRSAGSGDGHTAIRHERIASGTLLDPYIGPAAAEFQLPRVARSRGMAEDLVRSLVADATQKPLFGFLGEPRVDVLILNIMLDHARPE
jgi:K+-transporting ATPase c subunit